MKALRTTSLVICGILAALALLYVGGTFALLRSGFFKELINPPDSEVRINFEAAYSPYPGLFVVRGLDVRGQHDGNIMWATSVDRAKVSVSLWALLRNEVRISSARGTNAKIRLSSGRLPQTGNVVDGIKSELPNLNIQPSKSEAVPGDRSSPTKDDDWAVDVSGIDIQGIDDIWVDEYRFRGMSFLKGGLAVSAAGMLTVAPSIAELKAGSLQFGSSATADIDTIGVALSLPAFDPSTITTDELLTILDASISGDAQIENIRFLNYYLQNSPWVFLDSGKGSLKAHIHLQRGLLSDESFAIVEAQDLSASLWGQTARGSGKAAINFETTSDEKVVAVSVNFGAYRVEKNDREVIVGQGLVIKMASPDRHLIAAKDDWRLDVTLPPAEVRDLAYFNSFLPKGAGVRIVKGQGSVEADLKASAKNRGDDNGIAKIEAKGVEVQYADARFQGDASVKFNLKVADVTRAEFDASGTTVELKNVVSTTKTDKQRDWWGRIALQNSLLTLQEPVRFKGQMIIEGKDLRPLLGIFGVGDKMPKWIEDAVAFDGLKASALFDADEANFKLDGAEVRSEKVQMDGWFRQYPTTRKGALLVNYGILTVGVRLQGEDIQYKLVNANAWFKNQKP